MNDGMLEEKMEFLPRILALDLRKERFKKDGVKKTKRLRGWLGAQKRQEFPEREETKLLFFERFI